MDLRHRPSKILITGKSGSGKSTYFTRYVANAPHRFKFIFDHEGELAYRLKLSPAISDGDLLDDLPGGWVLFDPVELFPGDTPGGFNFFCEWVFNVATALPGEKLFCCDELQKLIGTNTCPWEFALLYETGRRYGVDVVIISQQPNLIHNRVRNPLTEVVTFAQMDPNAMEFLEAYQFNPDEVRALQPGEFLCRRTDQQVRGRVF